MFVCFSKQKENHNLLIHQFVLLSQKITYKDACFLQMLPVVTML